MLLPDLHERLDPRKTLLPQYRPVEPIDFFEALVNTVAT